ncbi:hypothetical protein L0B53_19030 (plasmid) [Vibrio sp. SS-MA-C1-2]|nr:hypothetical protein [Vibrio sp. SS-MA-C1-2]UJF20231.1 hypothetical protein L0B53_19030 [Vibrio sp. SS-MA-C1-2]
MKTILALIVGVALGVYLADNNPTIADSVRDGTDVVSDKVIETVENL